MNDFVAGRIESISSEHVATLPNTVIVPAIEGTGKYGSIIGASLH